MGSDREESKSPQPSDQTRVVHSLNPESFGLRDFGGLEQLKLLEVQSPEALKPGINPDHRSLDKSES
jgi:hypothetical protein